MTNLKLRYRFNDYLLAFIFIDILLFPNFPLFVMPISLPVVIGAIVLKKVRIKLDKELLVYLILSFLVLTSVILSFLQSPQYLGTMNVWMENIKRAFQLLTAFSYYFILKNSLNNTSISIKKILFSFMMFYIILGIVASLNIGIYFRILDLMGINNPFVSDWFLVQQDERYRYSYLFIDPNNAAYALQMVAFYMLLNESLKPLEKIFIYVTIFLSIIFSMSTGSILSAVIFFTLFIVSKLKKVSNYRTSFNNILKYTISYSFAILIVGISVYFLKDMFSNITEYSLNRISGNTDGGRLAKYTYMFSDKIPNLIGEGYVQIRNGNFFRPHSDHLRFLYSYGILAYLISLWFIFRKAIFDSRFLFVIPGFMAYSINTLIDEQKVLIILLLLVAYTNQLTKKRDKGLYL